MTVTDDEYVVDDRRRALMIRPRDHSDPRDPELTRRDRRRVVAVLVVVAVGWAAWQLWGLSAQRAVAGLVAEDVTVECLDGKVDEVGLRADGGLVREGEAAAATVPRLFRAPSLRCTLSFRVRNTDSGPVALRRIALSRMGSLGWGVFAARLQVENGSSAVDGQWVSDRPGLDQGDAAWDVSARLAPNETVHVTVSLIAGNMLCGSGTLVIKDLVRADVHARGRTFAADIDNAPPTRPGAMILGGQLVVATADDDECLLPSRP